MILSLNFTRLFTFSWFCATWGQKDQNVNIYHSNEKTVTLFWDIYNTYIFYYSLRLIKIKYINNWIYFPMFIYRFVSRSVGPSTMGWNDIQIADIRFEAIITPLILLMFGFWILFIFVNVKSAKNQMLIIMGRITPRPLLNFLAITKIMLLKMATATKFDKKRMSNSNGIVFEAMRTGIPM